MAEKLHYAADKQGTPSIRVLIAFEDIRSAYGEAFVEVFRHLRPTLTVRSASLNDLEHELGHFDPHVVVCSQPNDTYPTERGAWIQIPTDDTDEDQEQLAQICMDGEHWRTKGPSLSWVLEVIDEAQERLREGSLSECC